MSEAGPCSTHTYMAQPPAPCHILYLVLPTYLPTSPHPSSLNTRRPDWLDTPHRRGCTRPHARPRWRGACRPSNGLGMGVLRLWRRVRCSLCSQRIVFLGCRPAHATTPFAHTHTHNAPAFHNKHHIYNLCCHRIALLDCGPA